MAIGINRQQLCLIIKHLLEMRHMPIRIHGITMKALEIGDAIVMKRGGGLSSSSSPPPSTDREKEGGRSTDRHLIWPLTGKSIRRTMEEQVKSH
jgi:hypothetical protein